MPKYTTYRIDYNEEKYIDPYLDTYGHDILRAYKASERTTAQAIAQMRIDYGERPVNRWVARHHIVIHTPKYLNIKEVPYYA